MSRFRLPAPMVMVVFFTLIATGILEALQAADSVSPAVTRETIEADWLRQAELRYPSTVPSTMRPEEDARGGNDGVKDGKPVGYYGFHTDLEKDPWWQVDLGKSTAIAEVVIYNGSVPADAKRALGLTVLVSADARDWTEVYRHDGSMFCGPAQPLRVAVGNRNARYVRILLPYVEHLHLDEVEVFREGDAANLALKKPSTQSSISKWSLREEDARPRYPVETVVQRGLQLAADLRRRGVDTVSQEAGLQRVREAWSKVSAGDRPELERSLYLEACHSIRPMALKNPLLDFDRILFVKRAPGLVLCHCDEYLSWWSRPGGELCILEDFQSDCPRVRSLTRDLLPPGDVIRPDVSADGRRAIFGFCRHYPGLWRKPNKLDKAGIPEDAFYHLYEIDLDGSNLRRLTHGKYDDFDGRYLPDGRIVFLSTRRGQFLQCGRASVQQTESAMDLPDSFVRCGGDAYRPVSVHTLHVLDGDGGAMRAISPFESFEWNPSVACDGRVFYARWDYVDRHRMWHMGLWSTLPDGTGARAVFGNFTQGPYSFFEARSVPASSKIVFTASAHHSHAGGSLVLLDPRRGVDGDQAMTRLTPEVPFPEWESKEITHYYANPFPLSEQHYLCSWSHQRMWWHQEDFATVARAQNAVPSPANSLGIYLFDALGNLNLLYRDPEISSMCPIPIRRNSSGTAFASESLADAADQHGTMLLQDVYQGDLSGLARGSVHALRIVAMPPKTDPRMNHPSLGVTQDDPGKFVLGTVPVEADGSAYFHLPAGVPVFFQALDHRGMALQTMRSATYVQAGKTFACIGCHEHRMTAPSPGFPMAAARPASSIQPGPEGSWPLDYQVLVQPVLQRHCVRCHRADAEGDGAKTDLSGAVSYRTLIDYGGERSLRNHVQGRYDARRSVAGSCAAMSAALTDLLDKGHYEVHLPDEDWQRLIVWMDTYAQVSGSHSAEQAEAIRALKQRFASLLVR